MGLKMLYLIAESWDGPTKIGVSQDVKARLRQLQTGNPRSLFIAAIWEVDNNEEKSVERLIIDVRRHLDQEDRDLAAYEAPITKFDQENQEDGRFLIRGLKGEWLNDPPHIAIEDVAGALACVTPAYASPNGKIHKYSYRRVA